MSYDDRDVYTSSVCFFFQAEDGIRDLVRSRGLGDVYKRQGVLLRALPDYFIDKANKQGLFNGRIVVVKSTDSDSSAFDRQDGLYTVCVRGVENGKTVEENIINASVSRVLSAKTEWLSLIHI